MAVAEAGVGRLVLRAVVGARALVLVEHRDDVQRELVTEPLHLGLPFRRARQSGTEDEARQATEAGEGVLERQHPAPRGAKQVNPLEPEGFPQGRQLVEEGRPVQARRFGRQVRATEKVVGLLRIALFGPRPVALGDPFLLGGLQWGLIGLVLTYSLGRAARRGRSAAPGGASPTTPPPPTASLPSGPSSPSGPSGPVSR